MMKKQWIEDVLSSKTICFQLSYKLRVIEEMKTFLDVATIPERNLHDGKKNLDWEAWNLRKAEKITNFQQ